MARFRFDDGLRSASDGRRLCAVPEPHDVLWLHRQHQLISIASCNRCHNNRRGRNGHGVLNEKAGVEVQFSHVRRHVCSVLWQRLRLILVIEGTPLPSNFIRKLQGSGNSAVGADGATRGSARKNSSNCSEVGTPSYSAQQKPQKHTEQQAENVRNTARRAKLREGRQHSTETSKKRQNLGHALPREDHYDEHLQA